MSAVQEKTYNNLRVVRDSNSKRVETKKHAKIDVERGIEEKNYKRYI